MNKLKNNLVKFLAFMLIPLSIAVLAKDRKDGNLKRTKALENYESESYRLFVNKIDLPINNRGKIADVNIDGRAAGRFDGKSVIYSSGFFMSGKTNGEVWSNGVASASRIEDYIPGAIDVNNPDNTLNPGLYILKSSDPPFGESWQKWAEAVEVGAYFYDGDGDGVYNPVDKNGNGQWDPDEDAPDLLGDETVWCVYNDGLPGADRAFTNVNPQGIEIRQTVWEYAVAGDLGNIAFIRYSIVNRGTVADVLDKVFFGVWADADLGQYTDDLVGCDVELNAGFVYNDGPDDEFGANPPTFLIDFFQGPWGYTGNPNDFALNVKGPLLGIDTIWGYKNNSMTSYVHYMQGHPTQGDPDNKEQARYYLLGRNQQGVVVDPCDWEFGVVLGMDCHYVDGHFMYSGDPVSMYGWINTLPTDQRQMLNTGPFKLKKDEPVDIIVAYVVGRSRSAVTSVAKAKQIDRTAQLVYTNNFVYPSPPKPVEPIVKTTDDAIELLWSTFDQVKYREIGNGYDMRFEGFVVNMYQNGTTAEEEGGVRNKVTIARYDLANNINNVIYEDGATLERSILYEQGTQLDSTVFADPNTGWIKLRIETDPFTNGPIIKGKPYFITITGFALNYDAIQILDGAGNCLLPGSAPITMVSNIPTIINEQNSFVGIIPGAETYTPFREDVNVNHIIGAAESKISYSIYNKDSLTDHTYEIGFFLDSLSSKYDLYYYVKDNTTDVLIKDSSKNYYDEESVASMIDGVTLNVQWEDPAIKEADFVSGGSWAKPMNRPDTTGGFYIGSDIEEAGAPAPLGSAVTKAVHFNEMRRIEIRFGEHGKAYRYTSGTINNRPTTRFFYGGFVDGNGFVDVPFTAWIKDDRFGEERQLAVAITENGYDSLGRSDGVWNPGSDVAGTKEYIIVFNTDYSDTPDNLVYTGIPNSSNPSMWPDLGNGYNIPTNDPNYTVTDSMKFVARQPFFNALAVVGVESISNDPNFVPTDGVLEVPIKYVFTPKDIYQYKVENVNLTDNEAENIFARVNVYPNPLFAYNAIDSYKYGSHYKPDSPHITFTNLPKEVTISIYTLSGVKIRELSKNDDNPFLDWDLVNYDGLRAASGMYIAVVHSPKYGDKVLKFAIIMPQKQIRRY